MKLLSWNVRGLNSASKHRMLKNVIQQEKPTIVFLQETKSNSTILEKILRKIWVGCSSVTVDASGASGGLAIIWNPQLLTLQDFHASHFFIQATFHLTGTDIHSHLSNVYFPQQLNQKLALLDTLTILNSNRQFPLWIGGGDFNFIRALEEKSGDREKLEGDSIGFRNYIQNNHLMDIHTSNGVYTWSNKCSGSQRIASRLDRFLISDNAIHLGGDFHASIVPQGGPDHWPIMLQWARPCTKSNRPFRFEAFWFTNPNFKTVVKEAWKAFIPSEGTKMFQFQQKLKSLKQVLKNWNHTQFGNIFEQRKKLEQQMCTLQQKIIMEGRTEDRAHQEQILWTKI